jgi:hypothetical protein
MRQIENSSALRSLQRACKCLLRYHLEIVLLSEDLVLFLAEEENFVVKLKDSLRLFLEEKFLALVNDQGHDHRLLIIAVDIV